MKKSTTPTFLLELPLAVSPGQARRLRAHFEAARCLCNALLGEALARLHRMWADPAWQAARAMPKTQKQERAAAFSRLRQEYGFSEYALHDYAKRANCAWIARFLRAAGLPKLKVDISLTFLYDDLVNLFSLGCQVLAVDRGSFLAYWKPSGETHEAAF
jgi:hypothetical protein